MRGLWMAIGASTSRRPCKSTNFFCVCGDVANTMHTATVTVIALCYNRERFGLDCLERIRAQTFQGRRGPQVHDGEEPGAAPRLPAGRMVSETGNLTPVRLKNGNIIW